MSRIVDVEQLRCLAWQDGEHGTTFDDGVLWVLEKIGELPAIQTCEDTVSRQAAIDLFPNDTLEWDTNDGYVAPHLVRRMIKELPSSQPERKMGKWTHGRAIARETIGDCITAIFYDGWTCSECGCLVEEEREPLYKYCPICGADMRGEKNEIDRR